MSTVSPLKLHVNLPCSIFFPILCDFLMLSDVVQLDTAMCNRHSRSSFLAKLSSDTAVFEGRKSETHWQDYFTWLFKRNISVKYLDFSKILVADLVDFFRAKVNCKFLKTVKSLTVGRKGTHCVALQDSRSEHSYLLYDLISQQCKHLECLRIYSGSIFFEKLVQPPLAFDSLKELQMDHIQLHTELMTEILTGCSKLIDLSLWNCVGFSKVLLCAISQHSPLIEKLAICVYDHGTCLTEDEFSALADAFPRVTTLNLSGQKCLSDAALIQIATNKPELKALCLDHCTLVSDDGVSKGIAAHCHALQRLSLSRTRITGASIVDALAHLGRTLIALDINHCEEVTLLPINCHAVHVAPVLTEVNVEGSENITREVVNYIQTAAPCLRKLNVKGCKQLFPTTDSDNE
jgi:hypothetical protein